MDKKFIIKENVLADVLRYLYTRPYQEVYELISILSNQLEEIKSEKKETE